MPRSCSLLLALMALLAILVVPANAKADVLFGYTAVGDVAVPGQATETWQMTGVVRGANNQECLQLAHAEATARLQRKGRIVAGPIVNLCTPFVGNTEKRVK